jgi:hypothetical protein
MTLIGSSMISSVDRMRVSSRLSVLALARPRRFEREHGGTPNLPLQPAGSAGG